MPYPLSSGSANEAVENDQQFFIKDKNGEYENVRLDSLTSQKNEGTATVTLHTGEMRVIKVTDLYA